MPMVYTDKKILISGEYWVGKKGDDETIEEYRERCAVHLDNKYKDYMAAWEVRTGRPWTDMTKDEAMALAEMHPAVVRNPGWISKFVGR